MKILLLNPPTYPGTIVNRDVMGGFGTLQGAATLLSSMPPLKLAYVAAALEKAGFVVQIQDSVLAADTQDTAVTKIKGANPDIVGMETSLETVDLDLKTASRVKNELGAPLFILGAFVSAQPDYIFKNSDISFVVREEPEETSVELARYLSGDNIGCKDIKGLSYRVDGEIFHNPDRPFISDLSLLPHPARHLLDNKAYICDKGEPGVTLLGSRGCPISCPYCAYASSQGPKWRCRQPQDVVCEIKDVYQEYGIRYFQFRDAIFTFNKRWAADVCSLLIKEGVGDKVSWICETAVRYLDPELLGYMKKAGCRHIGIGVETADETLQRKYAKNKIISNEHAIEVFKVCKKIGISTCAFFMLGFPEESIDTIRKSITFAKILDSNEIQFTIVTGYPGTPMYEIFKTDKCALSLEEIEQFRKRAYLEFYSRPSKVLKELANPVVFFRKAKKGFGILRGKK